MSDATHTAGENPLFSLRDNPLVEFVINSTDPLLRPISKLIPPLGGMVDLSPIIALILLQVLEALIVGLLAAS